jgi:hypothetical protein
MNGPLDSVQLKEAEEWLASNFPRLFDLYQRSDKNSPSNYFDFRELFPFASAAFAEAEKVLSVLDFRSWEKLREKALPYIAIDNSLRRYQQLWSALDEARGYVFLANQGYQQIKFIDPNASKKGGLQSPDLFAIEGGSTAILEVKTVNESNENLSPNARWRHEAVSVRADLSPKFKGKLLSAIEQARSQLNSFPHSSDRKILLLVVRFDYGQKTGGHLYEELDHFIAAQSSKDGAEVYHQAAL